MPALRFLRVLSLALLVALPAAAGINRWTNDGPFGAGTVRRLLFDSANSSIVYAATENGLFRSADSGAHWTAGAALTGIGVYDLALSPSDPQTVYASTIFGLFKSSDRGVTWTVVHPFGSAHVAVSPKNANVVYSVSTGGPIRSTDGGVTFGAVGAGLPQVLAAVSALAVDAQSADTVYASFPTSAGVYKSTDGGAHWAPANNGLNAQVLSLVADPAAGGTLYAGGSGSTIFKSTDGAASWTPLPVGINGLFAWALNLAESRIVAGTSSGVFTSADGGASWRQLSGFNSTSSFAVAADPADASIVLAGGLFDLRRSTDGGATSSISNVGITAFPTDALAPDPHQDGVVYASGQAGFARSTDHGRTWTVSQAITARALAVDANSTTLYAVAGGLVRRSTNSGDSWSAFGAGLPGGPASSIAADPRNSGTVYAALGGSVYQRVGDTPWANRGTGLSGTIEFVTIDPNVSDRLYAGGTAGVFTSADAGLSWSPLGAATNGDLLGLAVDPYDGQHLYTWSISSPYESTDRGATWKSRADLTTSSTIAFDPRVPRVVYANSGGELDRSTDGGRSWVSLQMPGLSHGHNLFAVSASGRTLYAAGSGGGVFVLQFERPRAVARY